MIAFLVSAINICMVFLYGCIGETITEKSGHLNLGIPGIMCMGTLGGAFGVQIYMNSLSDPQNASFILLLLCALAMSMIVAAVGGLIYALLTVTLRSNQNITGLALTTFGAGVTDFFMTTIDKSRFAVASKLIKTSLVDAIPALKNLGWFADIFLSHGILVYIAIALAIVVAWFMRKTRVGLNLRAIGESPATADAIQIFRGAHRSGNSGYRRLVLRHGQFGGKLGKFVHNIGVRMAGYSAGHICDMAHGLCHSRLIYIRTVVRFQQLQLAFRHYNFSCRKRAA